MARQFVRALAAFAAGAVLTLGFAPGALADAGSAPQVGHPAVLAAAQARDYCDPGDTSSVTVVVDFSGVGGGIDIRCSSGSTGQQALGNAFGYSEIASQPGFVCQISGTPASDCQDTPPGSAYWSYWQAAPGGGWAYSSRGFSSSRVKPGGFEGWAYGSGGPPGVDPVLPAAPAPEPPAPEPEQPAPPAAAEPEQPAAEQPAAAPAPDDSAAGDPAADDSAPDPTQNAGGGNPDAEAAAAAAAQAQAQAQAEAEAAAQASAAQAAAVAAAAQAAQASAAAASASAASAAPASSAAGATAVSTSSGESAAVSSNESSSGSTIWFSVVALLAVASLGTAAVVLARRRRTGAGDDQAG